MTDAYAATVHSFRSVASRKIVQFVLEVPQEQFGQAIEISPIGAWVAVARLNTNPDSGSHSISPRPDRGDAETVAPAGEKPATNSLAQQAGILCNDKRFQKFMTNEWRSPIEDAENCAAAVRMRCRVNSRSEIVTGTDAGARWFALLERYRGWQAAERSGAR